MQLKLHILYKVLKPTHLNTRHFLFKLDLQIICSVNYVPDIKTSFKLHSQNYVESLTFTFSDSNIWNLA